MADPRVHLCDERCLCPVHHVGMFYDRRAKGHACRDPDCEYAHGYESTAIRNFSPPVGIQVVETLHYPDAGEIERHFSRLRTSADFLVRELEPPLADGIDPDAPGAAS